ncbi:hypothetical protein Halxa_3316 [Halopiger xanaduensis SH-6]|uniref:Uncharacterized protein n=1 Tax=Halopiger xanaduensis (strain DSM 18323 / JCM 14033 / SH-6) TaxID=797210 RepID=F8D836_HALXS|nr:hypothetical protein Halxa_3316 [Halopiger xanaduensis SH-6]
MDECPRCQGSLEELSLGDVSTVSCPHCEYADIPVEHESVPETPESWRDALNRFYEETVPKVDPVDVESEADAKPEPEPIARED